MQTCVCLNVATCPSVTAMWLYPSAATILSTEGSSLCVCVCVASVHWRVVGEEKERDKHLHAAIMGNFPTAAKLKPPKTKQRGQIYSLDESVIDAAHNRARERDDCYI